MWSSSRSSSTSFAEASSEETMLRKNEGQLVSPAPPEPFAWPKVNFGLDFLVILHKWPIRDTDLRKSLVTCFFAEDFSEWIMLRSEIRPKSSTLIIASKLHLPTTNARSNPLFRNPTPLHPTPSTFIPQPSTSHPRVSEYRSRIFVLGHGLGEIQTRMVRGRST